MKKGNFAVFRVLTVRIERHLDLYYYSQMMAVDYRCAIVFICILWLIC